MAAVGEVDVRQESHAFNRDNPCRAHKVCVNNRRARQITDSEAKSNFLACYRDLAAVRLFLSRYSSFLTGYSPFSAWPPKASATPPYRERAWCEPSTPVGSRNARNQRGETTEQQDSARRQRRIRHQHCCHAREADDR